MFDFIAVTDYTNYYYHFLLIINIYMYINSRLYTISDYNNIKSSKSLGHFVFLFVLLYMGTRPISYIFGDMTSYANGFMKMYQLEKAEISKDIFFSYFMFYCSQIMEQRDFFFLVDFLYIIPIVIFCKKYFKDYWFIPFLMSLGSFSFWSYGTNGIRNGLATSLFIWGLVFYDRKYVMYLFFILAYGFHKSLMIPIAAFFISGLYKNPKIYFYLWIASIPLSLVGGSAWENFFGSLEIGDDRVSDYMLNKKDYKDQFSSTVFRWDFLLYSSTAVIAGYYYIIKRGFKENFYTHLYGTYIIANAFWILVIRANFSNRFAYLSWFLMPLVIAYPILKVKFWEEHYKVIGFIFLAYYLFTYFMFLKS